MGIVQADDEQSDWPGPEPGMSVMQLTDEEMDPDISFAQFLPPRYRIRTSTRNSFNCEHIFLRDNIWLAMYRLYVATLFRNLEVFFCCGSGSADADLGSTRRLQKYKQAI
jgi:hypothetical protein